MLISVKMAMRNLLRHKRRTAFTVGLACVAATAAITSIGYMSATFYAVAENTIRGGIGHMQIAKTAQFEGLEDYPLEHGLSIADVAAIETALAEISPGAEILPRIEFQGVASAGDESLVFIGTALDPMAERALTSTGRRVIDGVGLEHTDPSNPYQVLIGKELARLLDVSVGESLTLMTPTTFGGLNAADVEIVGIASLGVAEVDRTYIAAPIALAQDLLRTEHVGKLAIALPDEVPVAETLARFKGTAPAGVTAKHWRELASLYDQLIENFS
ncbi:MAG: ABC transporter permease, partial [Pseudomonadota bacterium]